MSGSFYSSPFLFAGLKLSTDQFLSKLPSSIIKGGKVIDIKKSLSATIRGERSACPVTVVDTTTLQEIQDR